MSEQQKTSIWVRTFLFVIIIDLLIIIIGIAGRLLLDWAPLDAFHFYFYGAQAGLVLAALGLLQLIFGLVKKTKAHRNAGALTLGLGLLPLVCAVAAVGISGFQAPMIHDISTDLTQPPMFSITNSLRTAEENSLEYEGEAIAEQQRAAFPDIQSYYSDLSPSDAHNRALSTIEALGWSLIVDDQSTGNIEAFQQSVVFGFIDDVVIRIKASEAGSQIDLRSVSRVGLGDLGANAERIQAFLRAFEDG
jgi:uncharacterized protein (DUF1499 family)